LVSVLTRSIVKLRSQLTKTRKDEAEEEEEEEEMEEGAEDHEVIPGTNATMEISQEAAEKGSDLGLIKG
jgi:hypothetical protein